MASTDYEAMLQDVANHMSRSELLRQLSIRSSSTSGSSKRGSTRVTKQTSASNSPNYVQRRRTTGNHTARSCPRTSQESPHQLREQRLREYYSSKQAIDFSRPMSWHPGLENLQVPNYSIPTSEPALGNTITHLENLAVSQNPDSSVQHSIPNAFAMGYGYPMSVPSATYQTLPEQSQAYSSLDCNPEPECDSYPIYSVSDQAQYPSMSQASMYNTCATADYQNPQPWSQQTSLYASNPQIPPPMASYSSANVPTNTNRKNKTSSAPPLISRRKSKELVGMGLYDDRGCDFMSNLNSAATDNLNRDSVGKGLKLEETWQPPNEDDEVEDGADDEDDGYSTEEAEEVDDAPANAIMQPPPATEAQPAVYPPTYADMSNQSFFFNDDEEINNEDQYANYLAYGHALPAAQPKPQPQMNPGMQNYLWF
ncbi:hypothetical protein ACLMJK_000919 [Lecanora helva]